MCDGPAFDMKLHMVLHTPPGSKSLEPWIAAFLFAFCHTQPFHIYSNQNQYFLHAAAAAGEGDLASDWLATTADPTPLFTLGVSILWKCFGLWPMHALMFAFAAIDFLSLWHLLRAIGKLPASPAGRWLFSAIFTVAHAGIVRFASDRLLGADYPWFLQCGLANQYLLGPGLQPSVFGVMLLTGLALSASGRPLAAVSLIAGVNAIHATYLLPSGFLVAGIMVGECREGRWKKAIGLGGSALAIVFPVMLFLLIRFGPTNAESYDASQHILSDVRIPHHTKPGRWFDTAAAFQLLLIAFGLALSYRTRLFVVLLATMALAIAATLFVLASHSARLELLFPWRISAVLVPVSTALLAAWWATRMERRGRFALAAAAVAFTIGIAGAVAIYALGLGYREPQSEDPVLEYVRTHRQPGEVYLIPARFPKPNPPRGVYSNTFTAPLGPNDVVHFELARFRLATGAALYVDFKSIPYKDVEVLEWYRRVAQCVKWFGTKNWDERTLTEIRTECVTHIVAPTKLGLESPGLELVTDAGPYRVYRVR
jgi:hypothetical protein